MCHTLELDFVHCARTSAIVLISDWSAHPIFAGPWALTWVLRSKMFRSGTVAVSLPTERTAPSPPSLWWLVRCASGIAVCAVGDKRAATGIPRGVHVTPARRHNWQRAFLITQRTISVGFIGNPTNATYPYLALSASLTRRGDLLALSGRVLHTSILLH